MANDDVSTGMSPLRRRTLTAHNEAAFTIDIRGRQGNRSATKWLRYSCLRVRSSQSLH